MATDLLLIFGFFVVANAIFVGGLCYLLHLAGAYFDAEEEESQ